MQDKSPITVEDLKRFEDTIRQLWEEGKIRVPVHFCGGNIEQLLEIFKEIRHDDYVLSTHRNHFHYLLHGGSPDSLLSSIRDNERGGSMVAISRNPPFLSSGIVAGNCAIAVGIAWAYKESGSSRKVWAFVGDGATDEGHFYEAWRYAVGWDLPITFIIEDNDRATETTSEQRWGKEGTTKKVWDGAPKVIYYSYGPEYPHVGTGKYVQF
jgi:TPP-dependent pyruvate/acetoin dehydrogenase alpha subunit